MSNMTVTASGRRQAWGLAAALAVAALAGAAQAKTVTLAMVVKLDQIAPEDQAMYRLGGQDLDRIAYDDSKVDPVTHTVPITLLAHYIAGHWMPLEETAASSLDLRTYRLQFSASAVHIRPLVALFDVSGRMAMLARPDFHVLIAGDYVIDPHPLTPAQIAAPPPGWDSPNTMPILSGMPKHP